MRLITIDDRWVIISSSRISDPPDFGQNMENVPLHIYRFP